jgi:hypothetical protein
MLGDAQPGPTRRSAWTQVHGGAAHLAIIAGTRTEKAASWALLRCSIGRANGHCCVDGSPRVSEGSVVKRGRRPVPSFDLSAFAGFRFPPEVIVLAVRWYRHCCVAYHRRR